MDPTYARNVSSTLLQTVEKQRDLMGEVATGGRRIQEVADEYGRRRREIEGTLQKLGLEDPNPYDDLWEWYGRWKSGDLPSYASRRLFLREMFAPLISQLEDMTRGVFPAPMVEPTGWARVDRAVDKMRLQLSRAAHEEDYQQVGLIAREVLISLAQAVYDPARHAPKEGEPPGSADAARMLECYIALELSGTANEEHRSHAKACLKLALALQHDRSADFKKAALAAEAASSVVNVAAIVSGRRDPRPT
jgi:hypothetical protein